MKKLLHLLMIDNQNYPSDPGQKGAVPILILIAAIGIVSALAVVNIAPFKNSLLSSLFPKESSFAASSTDWPMYQGDPQHTGSTIATFTPVMGSTNCQLTGTLDISPCIQVRWKKSFTEWPNGQSQVVVSGGTVFLANMDGKLYAFDENNGAQKWVFDAGSPIAVTPAVINGKIIFGDFDGEIYALSTTNGSLVTNYPVKTGGPIYSSPVIVSENSTNKAFLGSNDGKLYGLNVDTGAQLFTAFDTGGSIIYSNPAWYNGKVFFAAENMNAYAINSSTGQQVWSKKLDGESNRGDHPLVITASNRVLFRSVPRFGHTGMGLKDLYQVYSANNSPANLSAYQTSVLATQGAKSNFLLNADTGAEITGFTAGANALQMIPMNTWYMNGQYMPMVYNNKDIIYPAFGGMYRIDTTTNAISTVAQYMPVRGDEYMGQTISNGWVFGGFQSNIARMKVDTTSNLTNPADTSTRVQLHGCKDCGDQYIPLDQPLSSNHWQGYAGDGYSDRGSFITIANGHAYYVSNGWLYAF